MPSRKIIPIIFACCLALGLIFFAVTKDKWTFAAKNPKGGAENADENSGSARGLSPGGKSGQNGQSSQSATILVEKAFQDSAERDSDNDGLKDWEENFWKTDPKNPDSDGDGILDGEEIKKNEEKALGKLGQNKTSGVGGTNNVNEPKTKTEEIGRNLFAEYLNLKKSGGLNQTSMENLVLKTVSQIEVGETKIYSAVSVKTISDSDSAGAKNYANAVALIREKHKEIYNEKPIIAVGGTINFEDSASVESITRAADLYKAEVQELAKLFVPKSLVAAHLALLNSYSASAEGLRGLANLRTDPITAITGIQRHAAAVTEEPAILQSIAQFFYTRGIVFSPDEAGSRINII